ncbi:fluoride efflux transporter CrcB [Methylomonas sp. MgM2]
MSQLIAIAVGGSVGAVLRFLVANGIYTVLGRNFPHGTLFVNTLGSLLMGLLTELLIQRFAMAAEYRAAILVGFLGAFTTFSTFALETLYLFEEGNLLKAFLNIFLSVVLCLTACWFGLIWGRTIFSDNIAPWITQHIPFLELVLSFLAAFVLSIAAQIVINYFDANNEIRAFFFISLLSGITMTSTLWFSAKHSMLQIEFHHLLSLFVINTLFGVAMIWSGSWLGNWIWQLKP